MTAESVSGTKLEETTMSDEESVKILQPVSLAMREAVLHLDTHEFGENRARNKRKSGKSGNQSDERTRKQKRKKIKHEGDGGLGKQTEKSLIQESQRKRTDLLSNAKSENKKSVVSAIRTAMPNSKSEKANSKFSGKKVKKKSQLV